MLRSLRIQNFRCFEDLTVEPLERVNLIAGKNNVGKTSLLDAIFISLNPINSDLLSMINRSRGLERITFSALEEITGFFFNQDIQNQICIASSEDNKSRHILEMYIKESQEMEIFDKELHQENDNDIELSGIERTLTTQSGRYVFCIKYSELTSKNTDRATPKTMEIPLKPDTRIRRMSGTVMPRELGRTPRHSLGFSPGIYLTTNAKSPIEDAARFSKLEKSGRQAEVLNTLRLLEPRLKRLSLLLIEHKPIIHGDIGMSELVPLPLMGEGLGRLLTILLAIAEAKNGVILIDEIENGLHYSVLTDIWKAIADTARRNNVQVFATTHSRECIMAANQAFQESEQYDFRYHRLDLVKGKIKGVTYNQRTLEYSDEMNFEVR